MFVQFMSAFNKRRFCKVRTLFFIIQPMVSSIASNEWKKLVKIIIISYDSSRWFFIQINIQEFFLSVFPAFIQYEGFMVQGSSCAVERKTYLWVFSLPWRVGCGKCVYIRQWKYFMHVLADLNYANGKRAAIKVIIKL